MLSRVFALIALVSLSVSVSLAQDPFGRITGRVVDATNAVVPGVTVTGTNVDTNVATAAVSNDRGHYQLLNLIPGKYLVIYEMPGFKTHRRGPIEVHVGDILELNMALEVGEITQDVTVTSEAPLLSSATASVGHVVDNRRIMQLPLADDNPVYLMNLIPGVVSTLGPTGMWEPHNVDITTRIGASGSGSRRVEFTLDGNSNMWKGGRISFMPPPEMLQEFRVQTAPVDASVGNFTGAHVNMVMKSGTNEFHGSLFSSYTGRSLTARDFFTNRSIYDTTTGPVTEEKIQSFWPSVRTNRYRASASGPVFLPKIYDGRNRTFWMYGLDVMDFITPEQVFLTVPTAEQRTGDFSGLLSLGGAYQIYDPDTIAPAPQGRFRREPFAGNIIPGARLNPIALKMLDFYPLPNVAGAADGEANYNDPNPRRIDFHTHTLRVDHSVTSGQRLNSTFTWSHMDTSWGDYFRNEATGQHRKRAHRGLAFGYVLPVRSNFIVNFNYGFTRFLTNNEPNGFGFDLGQLGFSDTLLSQLNPVLTSFPEITISGTTGLGSNVLLEDASNFHSFSPSASWIKGDHSLRFGFDYRMAQNNSYNNRQVTPRISFDTTWTRGPLDNASGAPTGQGFAAFLLGVPGTGYIERRDSFAEQSELLALYLQDDWKLTPRLTVNAGVRYELEVPLNERYNRNARGFDYSVSNPVETAAQTAYATKPIPEIPVEQFQVRGGYLFAGSNGVPRGFTNADADNLMPRIGLAYQLTPKTVIRSGYGVYFENILGAANVYDLAQPGFSQRTTLVPSLDNGLTFRAGFSNPFPDGILEPVGATAGLKTSLGQAVDFLDPNRTASYTQRWSLNVQRELADRLMLEVGYVGNRATGLRVTEDLNAVPAEYLSTSPERDQAVIDFLTTKVTNPFAALPEFAGSGLTAKTINRLQLLKPYPQFTGVSTIRNLGYSWYHALQAQLEKRFAAGYSVQVAYTWSKLMEATDRLNPTDPYLAECISDEDRPHRLVANWITDLPVGRGRKFLADAPGWVDGILGGWSFQGIYTAQSGPAIGFGNLIFRGNFADLVLPRSQRTVERWFNTEGFEKDSRKQLANNIRTMPFRVSALRADGFNNFDLSGFKDLKFTERVGLQIRVSAQDALNHAMFAAPNTSPTSALFGSVNSSVSKTQRRVLISARLTW